MISTLYGVSGASATIALDGTSELYRPGTLRSDCVSHGLRHSIVLLTRPSELPALHFVDE